MDLKKISKKYTFTVKIKQILLWKVFVGKYLLYLFGLTEAGGDCGEGCVDRGLLEKRLSSS